MVFKNLCVLVLWTKEASVLEGLNHKIPQIYEMLIWELLTPDDLQTHKIFILELLTPEIQRFYKL